jgi:hypothetical protein
MSPFNGIKVFCATMVRDREGLGEKVTHWLDEARVQRPGFQIVDVIIRQSSDKAFHCVSIVILFNENLATKEKKRG